MLTNAQITPDAPANRRVELGVDYELTDAEDDEVRVTVVWIANNDEVAEGPTFVPAALAADTPIFARITASDGENTVSVDTLPIPAANVAPRIESVRIEPAVPTRAGPIRAVVEAR